MKLKFVALIIALLTLHAIPALSKTRCTPVYIFGVSASFNDSIVYFTDIQIIDLPGTYSLSSATTDEQVASDELLDNDAEFIINIVDGTSLERNSSSTPSLPMV